MDEQIDNFIGYVIIEQVGDGKMPILKRFAEYYEFSVIELLMNKTYIKGMSSDVNVLTSRLKTLSEKLIAMGCVVHNCKLVHEAVWVNQEDLFNDTTKN